MCLSCLIQDCYLSIYLSMKDDLSDFENHTSWFHLIVQYYRSNINNINFYTCQNHQFHLTRFCLQCQHCHEDKLQEINHQTIFHPHREDLKECLKSRRGFNILSFVPKQLSSIFDDEFDSFHDPLYVSHYGPLRCSEIAAMA